VRRAESAADSDPQRRRRVEAIRFSYDNLMLYLGMRQAQDDGRFADAADMARDMLDLHLKIEQTDAVFYKIGDLDCGTEEASHMTGGWLRQNEARHRRMNGELGRLVALLPDAWQFRTDPHREGVIFRWFDTDTQMGQWDTIRTTRIWEIQGYEDQRGHGYDGAAWYRTPFELPKTLEPDDDEQNNDRQIMLNFGGVFGKMQVWVNGRFVTYRDTRTPWWHNPYNDTFDIDITEAVELGRINTLVIRVDNEHEWGGIFRRVFLWSPRPGDD
jgi:hypothetical protein